MQEIGKKIPGDRLSDVLCTGVVCAHAEGALGCSGGAGDGVERSVFCCGAQDLSGAVRLLFHHVLDTWICGYVVVGSVHNECVFEQKTNNSSFKCPFKT